MRTSFRGQREFAAALTDDPLRDVPAGDLLTGLRGQDVLVVFVESYGRVAFDDPVVRRARAPGPRRGTPTRWRRPATTPAAASSPPPRSAALSWLAHSTFQSGLRVDHERRYDELLASRRMTLAAAFQRAGWRTVAVVPSNRRDVARGCEVLRLGQDLRRAGPRVRRAGIRLRDDARPVHARRLRPP